MKRLLIIMSVILLTLVSFGQASDKWKVGKPFNSIFKEIDRGKFKGTTNGIIIIQDANGKNTVLDFQGSEAILEIIEDEYEVYDTSTKSYSGKTTSGKTSTKYQTYAMANGIGIELDGQWFEISGIDGACDRVINGLEYHYQAEPGAEYLILRAGNALELSNWQYLIRTEHLMEPDNIEELKPKKKTIQILPESTLIFLIKTE